MRYGQGKDILANFRRQSNYGAGLIPLFNMASKVGGAGLGAAFLAIGSKGEATGGEYLPMLKVAGEGVVEGVGGLALTMLNAKKTNPSAYSKKYNVGQQEPVNQQPLALNQSGLLGVNHSTLANNQLFTIGNPLTKQVTDQLNVASLAFAHAGYDTGAGYNPKSGTFRDGLGNVTVDDRPTFELWLTVLEPPLMDSRLLLNGNTLLAANGKKLNYLSFFN